MERATILDFELIFNEDKQSLDNYLSGISRSTLLSFGAFFLALKNHDSAYEEYEDFLNMFFSYENEELKNAVIEKIKAIDDGKSKYKIINPEAGLILFEYCYDTIQEGISDTKSHAEMEVSLFKAYLLINEIITTKEKVAFATTANLPFDIKYFCMFLSQSFPYSDLINHNQLKLLVGQIIKAIFLFEYLESNDNTRPLLEAFLNYYKVSDWKEYLKRLLPLILNVFNKDNETHTTITVINPQHIEFIDNLAIIDTLTITEIDFIKLRNQPLLKISKNEYIIIYDLFLIEKVYKSLYFKLNELNNNIKESIKIVSFP